jgi:hypothetical protein
VGRWLRPGHLVQQSVPLGRCTESRSRRRGSRWPRKPSVATRVLGEGHTATADAAQAKPQTRMKRKQYERELRRLHGELVAMQARVKASAAKVCVVFEGRDTAGEGRHHQGDHPNASARGCSVPSPCPPPPNASSHRRTCNDTYRTFPPGRGRDLRPQLVQPRRCRTGHGLLSPKTRSLDSCNWSQVSRRPWSTRASCW